MTDDVDKKIARHYKRMQAFVDNGLSENEAFDLAESMWIRDEDPQDDRRVCFECEHHVSKHCTAIKDKFNRPTTQPRFVLQRCDKFKLKGKK